MRILHVLDHSIPLQSGYTFRTRNILREQAERGWYTCHLTGLKHFLEGPAEEEVDGLRFYRTNGRDSLLARMPLLGQWQVIRSLEQRLDEIIERERPDIIHAHSPALNGVAALAAARRHRLPLVYECRAFWEDAAVDLGTHAEWGLRYRASRALESHVFRNAHAVTTICEGLKQDIAARGVSEGRITVIPNAVDIRDFPFQAGADRELQYSLGLQGRRVLGFVGSFYAYEGLLSLLNAMPALLERHPDTALLLVGGGPEEARLRQCVAKLGLDEAVLFTGRVPHHAVADYYSLIDVLVYPRLPMRLTHLVTPLKPLEAMAQGKVVVASDVGGHRELIRDGVNGKLFAAGSIDSLSATLTEVFDTPQEWPALALAGRRFVETERNWPASVSHYQPLYESLL